MSSKKSKNNSTGSKEISIRLKDKKSKGTKLDSPSDKELNPEIKFKKVKKYQSQSKELNRKYHIYKLKCKK
jgi:hypothetical protein